MYLFFQTNSLKDRQLCCQCSFRQNKDSEWAINVKSVQKFHEIDSMTLCVTAPGAMEMSLHDEIEMVEYKTQTSVELQEVSFLYFLVL